LRITAPINLAAGDPQIAYVIDHSETEIIFVSPEEEPRLRRILEGVARPIRVVLCDTVTGPVWPDQVTGAPTATPAPIADHDNRADGLLMYTSGTTGNPKGAMLRQRAPLCGGENAIIAHELTPEDRAGAAAVPHQWLLRFADEHAGGRHEHRRAAALQCAGVLGSIDRA
jgi:long-subunit acyl-CoA synthetase (AMP-forming)